MACACSKKNGGAKFFLYTAPNGTTTQFRTEIEARAAKIRTGGDYVAVT